MSPATADAIFAGLNPAQKDAVDTLEGPILILAGAGSGKTKTLTHRIANLIYHGVPSSRILALTFTNKAAKEMRARLAALLSEEDDHSFMPWMGTFHAICVRMLRMEAPNIKLKKDFVIYDTDDRLSLIKLAMRELKFDEKLLKPRLVEAVISNAKNTATTPTEMLSTASYPRQRYIAEIYAQYEKMRQKIGALDFDDLLLYAAQMLQDHADIRARWQEKFAHILIDEYQDTNHLQYNIVRLLVNKKRNICAVGDDWQSIYSWRGADFSNILNFSRDFKGAKVVKLEQNYRSTQNILDAAQAVIAKNHARSDKVLFTKSGKGAPVEVRALKDERQEANFVAQRILSCGRPRHDIAILYRTNAQSQVFEREFLNWQIPYKLVGGVRFYDRKEIRDLMAYLHFLVNPNDRVALGRIINVPRRGLGAISVAKISAGDIASLSAKNLATYRKFESLMASLRAKISTLDPANLINELYLAIGYEDFIAKEQDEVKVQERKENVAALIGEASHYQDLNTFLADAALMSSADEQSSADAVTLMTLHAAKGLEFPVVFLVGMEEGLLPHVRATTSDNPADIEEERRLTYVGMTRAREQLFLTYARSRYLFGGRSFNFPSRFLKDLDPESTFSGTDAQASSDAVIDYDAYDDLSYESLD